MYTVKDVVNMAGSCHAEIDGEWVPARPENHKVRTLRERFSDAWAVFTGKADAVKWPNGQ